MMQLQGLKPGDQPFRYPALAAQATMLADEWHRRYFGGLLVRAHVFGVLPHASVGEIFESGDQAQAPLATCSQR